MYSSPTNYNAIIDVSVASRYFVTHYRSVKGCLFTYLTCMLYKALVSRAAMIGSSWLSERVCIEDQYYDNILGDLLSSRTTVDNVMHQCMIDSELLSTVLYRLLDDVHDVAYTQCNNVLDNMIKYRSLTESRVMMMTYTLISERTLIFSNKLIEVSDVINWK